MNADLFEKYWVVFDASARPLLEATRALVQRRGVACSDVDVVDKDVDQGLGFMVDVGGTTPAGQDQISVELMLQDGDERGLESEDGSPALAVSFSIVGATGDEYFSNVPENFTRNFGTSSPDEIIRRILLCVDPVHIANEIRRLLETAQSKQVAASAASGTVMQTKLRGIEGSESKHDDRNGPEL